MLQEQTTMYQLREELSPGKANTLSTNSLRSRHVLGVVIFVVAALFFVINGVAPTIFDDNEGLYAGAVKEMTQRHDWLLPTTNGLPRIQKPPLVYWLTLVSTSVFGLREWTIRLPNALFTALWVYATYLLGLRLKGARFGATAAIILASMLGCYIFTHLVQPEPFLATFISLTFFCFLSAHRFPERTQNWMIAAWACMGLACMSKGLHGALWPLGTAVLCAIAFPEQRTVWRGLLSWRGMALFALIVAPWYIALELRLPGVLRDHFFNEQLGAALNTRWPNINTTLPLWQFYLQHLVFFAPWTLTIPAAIYIWKRAEPTAQEWTGIKIMLVWLGLTFVSLSFSNLQDYYAMTSWGVVALFLAAAWKGDARMPAAYLWAPCVIMAVVGLDGLIFANFFSDSLINANETVAPIGERDTFSNALNGIPPGAWKECLPLMHIVSWALLAGGAAGTWLIIKKKSYTGAVMAIAIAMAICFSCATAGFGIIAPLFSLAEPAKLINKEAKAGTYVACEGAPHHASSLHYYLNYPVHWVDAIANYDFAGRVQKKGGDLYLSHEKFLPIWASSKPVYFIVEESQLAQWQKRLGATGYSPKVYTRAGTRVVLVNQ